MISGFDKKIRIKRQTNSPFSSQVPCRIRDATTSCTLVFSTFLTHIFLEMVNDSPTWKNIIGTLKNVSCDGRKICGTDPKDAIFISYVDNPTVWRQIPGGLKQLVILGGAVYGVNNCDQIYLGCSDGDPCWKGISGTLSQISYDGLQLVGTNKAGDVFVADENLTTTPNWRHLAGIKLSQVDVYGGTMFGVNDAEEVYTGSSRGEPNWKKLPGNLNQISYDGTRLYGVRGNSIFIADKDLKTNPNWTKVTTGTIKWIDGYNGKVVGCDTDNAVFTADV